MLEFQSNHKSADLTNVKNINPIKKVAMMTMYGITISSVLFFSGCAKKNLTSISSEKEIQEALEKDMGLRNLEEETKEIKEIYKEAKQTMEEEKIKEFYTIMRNLYLDYDESKETVAIELIPTISEAEAVFRNTGYTFTEEELEKINTLDLYHSENFPKGK